VKQLSSTVEGLRTPSAFPMGWSLSAFAVVAMISYSSMAAGRPGENSVAMHPCSHPHSPPRGPGGPKGKGESKPACKDRSKLTGEELFRLPFPGAGNQRSCATCHVPEDNFTLTPAHVERVWKKNPKDPLFSAIDADDPTAATLTFEHLKKGLIRVGLTLPDNMDLIDEVGNVTTPADRTIYVWRSVPSIADAVLTAPYQLDGREATLEQQAQGAITGHSQGGPTSADERERIANFERGVFSSDRARWVAFGVTKDVEDWLRLSPQEQRGREVYKNVCESCHGGANKTTIVNREVHALNFAALRPDGTIRFVVPATEPQTPVYVPQPSNEFINIGSAFWNYMTQNDLTDDNPSFVRGVSFPQYRFRFYKDASKTQITADLPPNVGIDPDNPLNPGVDSDGNFIVGPNQFPQRYTADPGRAAITGNPYDFEAFDIPTLRGISKTAPYWHNHISATLEEVVELYSDQLLSRYPLLVQPGEKEHGDGPGPEEAMTRQQKDDLVAFLKRL
jgi:cytochrome c peroxidase